MKYLAIVLAAIIVAGAVVYAVDSNNRTQISIQKAKDNQAYEDRMNKIMLQGLGH